MPFRFVHTADLHLDSPLRSLALKNPELAELVRGATRTALARIVDLCLAESVDALLIAGDLYDGSQTSMNTALYLASELRRLDGAGIRVFLIRGNHDFQSTIKKELTLPSNVHLFSGRVKPVLAKSLGTGREVYIHGVGFDNPHAPDSLLSSFQGPIPDAVNIGMLHTSLAGAPGHDPYAPCSVAELARHGFDYWALGHVHLRQVHSETPLIVMPGMPQGRDINEAGPKTVTLVAVGDDGRFEHREHEIGQAVFERVLVDLSGTQDWRQMLETVGEALSSLRSRSVADHLIVRMSLMGSTPLAWKLRRDPDFLLAELSNLAAGLTGCWIEKIDIECRGMEASASLSGPDPVEELAALIRSDVLPSHAFRQEAGAMLDELLLQLPREVRESLAGNEVAATWFTEATALAGSDDVLAHLHGDAGAGSLMRLNRLDLVRYGKFTGRSLDFGAARAGNPDFHLVYGPNEAGKSTLFSGFLDLLFGIDNRSAYGFLHPYETMRVGGVIETGGRTHAVARVKRKQNTLLGPDDQPLPDNLFSAALGSIDRATYQMMFSLDDDSIEKGGDSILKSEGELGALLFSASSGLPDSSAILSGLKAQADAFYKPQGRKHRLAELKAELDVLKDEKNALDVNAREFSALRKARDAAAERHEAAVKVRAELRVSLDHARDRLEGLPLLVRLRGLRSELADFGDMPEPPSAWHGMLPLLQREEADIGARLDQLEDDIERRATEIAAIERDGAVLAVAADIRDLEHSGLEARHRTAASDMPNRLDERDKIATDIAVCLARLDCGGAADPAALILPAAVTGRIQDLAQKHSALNERLVTAVRERQLAAEANDEAIKAQTALMESDRAVDAGDPAHLADILQALRQNDCLLRQQTANRQIAALEDLLADKVAALAPTPPDSDGLAALVIPDDADIAEWTARRTALTEQLKRLDDRIAEETAVTAAEESRLGELTRTGGFAGDEAALTLRQERDLAWRTHAGRLDAETARAFETALRNDDEVAALRLARAQDLAQARGLSLSIAERSGRLSAFRQQHQTVLVAITELRAEISASARRCGLAEDTKLNQLVAWLARRAAALEVRDQLRAAQQDLRLATVDAQKALERLTRAFKERGLKGEVPDRLEDAMAFAERIMNALQSIQRAHAAAAETVDRTQSALRMRDAGWVSADAEMSDWNAQWHQTAGTTWLSENGKTWSAQEIAPVLAVLQDLDKLIQRKADLDHRIDGMRRDQAAFAATVKTLAERLSLPVSDESLAAFQSIRERHADAEQRETLFRRLSDENDVRISERGALVASRERHDAQKRGMLDLFDCTTLADVGVHLEAAKARARLLEHIAEAEAALASRLNVGRADEAEMILSSVDKDGLQLEMAELQSRWEQCDRDASELHAERRDAERTLSAISGDDAAAHIAERRRTVLAEIEERATSYLRLRLGILAGETALRLYRERHRSAMMRRASAAFSVISGGDYEGLTTQAEKGEEFLIANAAGGGSKLARDLSKGTRFQLYLALRMAGYHEIAATRESLPFIADDIMETFDDGRAEHAFSLMADMAGVGQVIYLTHHQHLCDIARKACPDVTIHTL